MTTPPEPWGEGVPTPWTQVNTTPTPAAVDPDDAFIDHLQSQVDDRTPGVTVNRPSVAPNQHPEGTVIADRHPADGAMRPRLHPEPTRTYASDVPAIDNTTWADRLYDGHTPLAMPVPQTPAERMAATRRRSL